MKTVNSLLFAAPQFSLLSESQLESLHLGALEVLRRTGIRFFHQGALEMLKEAILEALESGKAKDEQIQSRMKDVEKAVESVKKDLIAKLPKAKRSGRVVTKDLEVEVLPAAEEVLTAGAA